VDVVDFGEGVKLEMVLVPAGKFKMGLTKKELADFKVGYQEDMKKTKNRELGKKEIETVNLIMNVQGKRHEVTLTKPFYMGKHEVTQEQWESVMGKNPSDTKEAKLPVTDVSWNDCQDFINKLNEKTNGGYRLPSEAEWEYACRAGSKTVYSFGNRLTKSDANIDGASTKTGGRYKSNAFGLFDMHGNVWEWCEDWIADYPAGAVSDPKGPEKGTIRVLRGGSWYNNSAFARSSFRFLRQLNFQDFTDGGFRLAMTP